jgi:putative CocE/NonD family hydrolase
MPRPSSPRRNAAVAAAVLLLAVALGAVIASANGGLSGGPASPPPRIGAGAADVAVQIPASGGVALVARVTTPAGRGPYPLIVMPASWGRGGDQYTQVARTFASSGYEVVAYGQRGFGGSGGSVDLAGAATQADVSTVITWALKNTPASETKIASVGISYGAVMSLLAAAQDDRIRAVVAMSGWSDMSAALAPSGTPNVAALRILLTTELAKGTLTAPVSQLAASVNSPNLLSLLATLSPSRSASAAIAALNKNKPAIMLANPYEDSLLYPGNIVTFFDQLTTPKRLQLAPGDHGGPEIAALSGRPDTTIENALAWLDHHLRGRHNAMDGADPIELQDIATRAWHGYRTWPAASVVYLAAPNEPDDVLASNPAPWRHGVTTGTDTTAASGPAVYAAPNPYLPPKITIASLAPAHAFVWTAAPVTTPLLVSGRPVLHVTPSSSTGSGTLYAYLYDVDTTGSASLMTFAPYTFAASGSARSIPLGPTSWTVATGHHVVLVVDTVDARYRPAAPSGSTLTLSSPASLDVPH